MKADTSFCRVSKYFRPKENTCVHKSQNLQKEKPLVEMNVPLSQKKKNKSGNEIDFCFHFHQKEKQKKNNHKNKTFENKIKVSSAALVERKISKRQKGGSSDNKQGNELPGEKRKIKGKKSSTNIKSKRQA